MNHYELKGKRVLLIGSGDDLNGRAMQVSIDGETCGWDAVARINRMFGDTADVGERVDIIFVAKREWGNWFFRMPKEGEDRIIVAFRDGCACDRGYREKTAQELHLGEVVSSGLCAVHWLLEHGAQVDIIGFNAPGGVWSGQKVYAVGRMDASKRFDWAAELAWIKAQDGVTFL